MTGALRRLTVVAALALAAGCAGSATPAPRTTAEPAPARGASAADTTGMIPVGLGTLRQEDIAVSLQLPAVAVRLIPLDEAIIRVLARDSYSALRGVLDSRGAEIERLRRVHQLRERRVWYVTFIGLAPDARFTPDDLTITAGGREFRPIEILAVTAGFRQHRLQPMQTQTAVYLFDDGLDPSQPLTVTMGSERSTSWTATLERIERERALIRARRG